MKKTAFIVILVVLLWASYAYGGRQGKIPGFVNRLESAILVGVNELESARMSTSENAQIVGRGFKAYIVASLASDLPANTAQAKVAEPVSPTVEARPTNTIEQDSQSCKEVTLKVKVPSANLRPNPQISESEHPLAVLQKNEEVIVTGVKGAWLKVKFFETEGWMAQTTLEPFTCKAKLP